MSVHGGHRERMRKRFIDEDLDNFSPHNVLELLLFYAIPQKDTNEIAHRLLNTFGSLSGVLDAPVDELKNIKGIGENAAVFIKLLPSACRRYMDDKFGKAITVNSPEEAGKYLKPKYIGVMEEIAVMLFLDGKSKILGCDRVSEGVVNEVVISKRKIIELAVRYNATAVILSHNHPRGFALPSEADVETTWQIRSALEIIGVRLIDHIIVADDDFVSMGQTGKFKFIFDKKPLDDDNDE